MKIEQLLHGYDNGHRLLAGSILLKNNKEMDIVATLSDWSEYVGPNGGESSYVTAYPLQTTGYYVIAKTWYADEMKRPGCVWTHSLLIPFEVLNCLDDFKRLLCLFKRPSKDENFDEYSHTIEYENKNYSADDYKPIIIDRKIEFSVLYTFLNTENAPVIFDSQERNGFTEEALLAVMNILPQKMIQNISWCTGTAYIRKLEDKPLTCQFVSHINAGNLTNYLTTELKWQTYILNAIMRGDVNQGQLIRMFSEDIEDKSANFVAIVEALYTLEDYFNENKTKEDRFKDVLGIITKAFPNSEKGMVIKKLLVNRIFTDRYCKNYTFFLSIATLPVENAFDKEKTGLESRWEKFISEERELYLSLLGEICKSGQANSWGIEKMKESVDILSSEDVADMIKSDFHLFGSIVLLNSELLNKIPWQILTNKEIELILPMFLDDRTHDMFRNWEQMFTTLLEKDVEISNELATEIFSKNENASSILLNYMNQNPLQYIDYSLEIQLRHKPDGVLKWLGSKETITDNVAYAIVNAVSEHSNIVIDMGAKIWRPFFGLNSHNLNTKVYVYLFSLSFNWPSDSDALELMRISFYPLHTLQSQKLLGYKYWSHIAAYMEAVMIWDEWDNCKKMRKTVIKRLKNAGKKINILEHFTPDVKLNELLKKMW